MGFFYFIISRFLAAVKNNASRSGKSLGDPRPHSGQKVLLGGIVREGERATRLRILCRIWRGATYAQSKEKALSNLSYQFKKSAGLAAYSRVVLEGSLSVG